MSAIATAQRMMRIFRGYEATHYFADFLNVTRKANGKLVPEYGKVIGPATLEEFEAHLAGRKGLLIVPVTPEGVAYWGKIDVDDYKIDPVRVASSIKAHKLPLVVERTKSGGVHLAFYPRKPWVGDKLREKLAEWAAELGFARAEIFPKQDKLDPAKDSGSCINLPYFGGDKATNYALSADGARLTVEEWLSAIESLDDRPGHTTGVANVATAADFLAQFWTEGRRDRMNIAVAGTLLRAKIDESAVEALIEGVRAITGDFEDARKSVAHIAESILTDAKKIPGFTKLVDPAEDLMSRADALELLRLMGAKPPPPALAFEFKAVTIEQLNAPPPPLAFTVRPLFPAKKVTLVVAEGGTGKTTFGMRAAIAVASGRELFGLEVTRGKACYVAMEEQPDSLHRRLHRIVERDREAMRAGGASEAALNEYTESLLENFYPIPAAGFEMMLVTMMAGQVIQNAGVLLALIEQLPSPLELLVLDPIARLNGAEENSNAVATAMIGAGELLARRLGCTVVFMHHTGKAAAREGDISQYSARGGSGLVDAARSSVRLISATMEEARAFTNVPEEVVLRGDLVRVVQNKINDAAKALPFFLRRQELDFELFTPEIASDEQASTLRLRQLWEWHVRGGMRAFSASELDPKEARAEVFGPGAPSRLAMRELIRSTMARGDLIEDPAVRRGNNPLLRFRAAYAPPGEEI
jgi:hypothetical protein